MAYARNGTWIDTALIGGLYLLVFPLALVLCGARAVLRTRKTGG